MFLLVVTDDVTDDVVTEDVPAGNPRNVEEWTPNDVFIIIILIIVIIFMVIYMDNVLNGME